MDNLSLAEWTAAADSLRGRRQVTDLHLVNLVSANDCALATFDAGIVDALRPGERHLVDLWG